MVIQSKSNHVPEHLKQKCTVYEELLNYKEKYNKPIVIISLLTSVKLHVSRFPQTARQPTLTRILLSIALVNRPISEFNPPS